jgi:hypothetical protein
MIKFIAISIASAVATYAIVSKAEAYVHEKRIQRKVRLHLKQNG